MVSLEEALVSVMQAASQATVEHPVAERVHEAQFEGVSGTSWEQ